MPHPLLGEDIKAYVELRKEMTATEEELIIHVKDRLAAYKYPRSIEFRDELPKGSTGKILKESLKS